MKNLIHRRCTFPIRERILRKLFLLFLVLSYCLGSVGQKNLKLSNPRLNFENNRLIIEYDMLGVSSIDRFEVELEIRDAEGREIEASSVYGDVGKNVSGAMGKQIIWDLAADELAMDQRISVELFATYIEPPVKSEEKIHETQTKTSEQYVSAEGGKETTRLRNVSMGNALFLSTLVPGLGISKAYPGKPFWIAGAVGYGSLASGITFWRLSADNYTKYLNSSLSAEEDPNYPKAVSQKKLSRIFIWTAVGIWVADLGYTWFQISNMQKLASGVGFENLSLASTWDHINQSQSISLIYTF